MADRLRKQPSFRRELYQRAILDSFIKLDPRVQLRNPVMFVVEVGSVLTTGLWIQALFGKGEAPAGFIGAVALWLWFTVLFANFSEALAEGRGKAQAEALRSTRKETSAKKLARTPAKGERPADFTLTPSTALRQGDLYPGGGRRYHPGRRRGDRGDRLGGRIGRDRRIGPGDPRIGRRPQRRDRRDAHPLGLAGRSRSAPTRARVSWTA